jgi:caffeoyl-CoA O-methyltransferase
MAEQGDIFKQVDEYIEGLYPADPVLAEVEASIVEAGMPQISVTQSLGRLLHTLAVLIHATRVLEIGTLGGYSTIWLARALPPAGRIVSIESVPAHADMARANLRRAGEDEHVELIVGRALDVLPDVEQSDAPPFDLIFIDADKAPLVEYFEWALRLARPGTLIIADNVIREGKVLDPDIDDASAQGARRFNSMLARHDEVTSVILQTVGLKEHDGIALAVVR